MLEILPWGNDFHDDDDVCSLSHNRMALPPKSKPTYDLKKMWLGFFYFIVIHYIERTKIGILLSITSLQLLAFHFPFWHVHHPKLSVNISVESERSQWQQHKILVTWQCQSLPGRCWQRKMWISECFSRCCVNIRRNV